MTDKKTKPATKAKRKYRDSNYDRVELNIPTGEKERLKKYIELSTEYNSVNSFVWDAILEKKEKENKD